MLVFKDLGLVSQVFNEQVLSSLIGHIAVGHCRYSTTGSGTWENAQPTFRTTATGSGLALGHNGNLVNTAELLERARAEGVVTGNGDDGSTRRASLAATTDSDLIAGLLASGAADTGIEEAALKLLPTLRGAFCLVFSDERTLYAARDPHGVRPSSSAGSTAAGWWPPRPRRSTSSERRSSARSSRASCWPSMPKDCAAAGSRALSRRVACSSTSTSPARTPRSPGAGCTPPGWTSAVGSPRSTRPRPTW